MPEENKAEQRGPFRSSPRKTVEIATGVGANIRCELLELSTRGARLSVSHAASVPDVFILVLNADLNRWVQVIWRADKEVGVRFAPVPASLSAVRDKSVP